MSTFFKRHQRAIIWAVVIAFLVGGVGLFSANQSGLFGGSSTQGASGEAPTYAASVGGEKIGLTTFQERVTQLVTQYQNLYTQSGQDASGIFSGASGAMLQLRLQAGAMSDLIRQTIYAQEAKSRGIRVSKETIDASLAEQYAQLLASYKITEEQLVTYLSQSGETLESFKNRLRTSIESQYVVDAVGKQVAGTIEPSEAEIGTYFEKNLARYDQAEQVQASHILVDTLETANSVRAKLEAGGDFAALAKEYSLDAGTRDKGGDLGWFGRGQMVKEFEEAAFSLKKGELSQPVKTAYGYHIIRITDRKEARTPTLAEVREQVVKDYVKDETTTRVDTWYGELYKTKSVDVKLDVVRAFLLQEENVDLGLAEFERLQKEGTSSDEYVPYYIGQIYESKASILQTELTTLGKIAAPTTEQTQRIGELKGLQKEYQDKALAAYLAALEDVEADENFLNHILELSPDSVTATFLLGKLYADRDNFVEAEMRYAEVLAKDPANVTAYVASGDLAAKQANYSHAKTRYEGALRVRPNDAGVMLKLVGVDLAMDQVDQAGELIAAIRQVDPGNAKLTIAEGDVAYARLTRAVRERDTLANRASRSEAEEKALTIFKQQAVDYYATTVARYEEGLKSGGGLDLDIKLGNAHLAMGKLADAEREYHSVIVRSPYRADAYEGMGNVYLAKGQTADALTQLRTALSRSFDTQQRERLAAKIVSLDPTDADTVSRLAKIYAEQYKWSAAVREYATLIELKPTMEDAYLGIAEAYRWRTEYDSAIDYLKRGLARVDRDAAKVKLYDGIVTTVQTSVGQGKPLTSVGLDALVESAKIQLARGNTSDALARLEKVRAVDATYRADEVGALIVDAGGTAGSTP
ncbi:MAG: peptidylprolyl isomerase [Candidatus Bipolaricaulis sp.]|nr:peptidylprolyl isomerase [Candidatus Bipolaricaulis sp.]